MTIDGATGAPVADRDQVIEHDLAAHADALLITNAFLTLSTVDAAGRPWTTPVYFAPAPGRRLLWTSETQARHSRNIADRPEVSLVIFDSTVAPYHGRAVYAVGTARQLDDDDVDEALRHYPGPSRRGAEAITREDVTGTSTYRIYQMTAAELWVLCPREPHQPCPRHGVARDHRARVP